MIRRWGIAVVGAETGDVHELAFVRFWRRLTALRWAAAHNVQRGPADELTFYAVVDRRDPQVVLPRMSDVTAEELAAAEDTYRSAFDRLEGDVRRRLGGDEA